VTDGAAGVRPARPLLRQRNFGALWWGQLISILGERFTYLALLGLLSTHTDHFRDPNSSLLLTLLANLMLLPVLLFAPFTGAWLDRVNLKRVMVVSDLLRAGLVALIPVAYAATHLMAPVFALVFLLFLCNVFFLPAKSALTPEIVPESQLIGANALLSGAGIAATAVGALAGGWVVVHMGWSTALLINAVTYLVSVWSLALVRYRGRASHIAMPALSVRGYLDEVRDGWAAVQRTPSVRLSMLALGAVWVGGGFMHVAGNQHIQQRANIPGMERVGVLMTVLGLGAGLGTWWMNHHARRWPSHLLLGGGLIGASAMIAVFALVRLFWVYAAVAFVIGVCAAPVFVLSETLLQRGATLEQRGRVFSARDFMMRLAFMLAVAAAGAVTRADGTSVALLSGAGLVLFAGLVTIGWEGVRDVAEPDSLARPNP
jgi:MFS family permease